MAIDPTIIVGGAVGAISVGAAALYAYKTGESAEASVDLDDDGNDEAAVEFGGDDTVDRAEKSHGDEVESDTAEPPNPTPDHVIDKNGLTDIKGIQETRAKNLSLAGFSTPADVYYASDKNLEEVDQIGPYTVEQIREDIGGIGHNPNGESDGEAKSGSGETTGQSAQTEQFDSNSETEQQ
jgi:predicted flap endonuclease-1-like 5' DNA nuclease